MINSDDEAFPLSYDANTYPVVISGISIRVYLAAKAMQGLSTCSDCIDMPFEQIARYAVEQADALIAELNKKKE